jgi:hypothetical protein
VSGTSTDPPAGTVTDVAKLPCMSSDEAEGALLGEDGEREAPATAQPPTHTDMSKSPTTRTR